MDNSGASPSFFQEIEQQNAKLKLSDQEILLTTCLVDYHPSPPLVRKRDLLLQTKDPTTRNTLEHSFELHLSTCKAQGWNEANTHKNEHKTPTAKPLRGG